MKATAKQYAEALNESLQESSARKQRRIVVNLVKTVQKNKDQKDSDKIISEFDRIVSEEKQVKEIEIITSEPISHLATLARTVHEKTGINYKVSNRIDGNLIAGSIIRIADYKIDMSIKSRLQKAKDGGKVKARKLPEEIEGILKIIKNVIK